MRGIWIGTGMGWGASRGWMTSDPLKAARDAVFCKLGRNVALFQQLEQHLKLLIVLSRLEGSSAHELSSFGAKRKARVAKQPFGNLIRLFLKDVLGSPGDVAESAATVTSAIRIRTAFQIEGAEHLQMKKGIYAALLAERNRLVHQLVEDHNLFTEEGIRKLDALLDPQADRIRSEIEDLRSIAKQWNEMLHELTRQLGYGGDADTERT
jgi:hypothetical protein